MAEKILVTGGSGFVGGHVVKELFRRGYAVRVADIRAPDIDFIDKGECEFVNSDLRDSSSAAVAFKGIDKCIALAARSGGIRLFNEHPAEMLDDNARILSTTFNSAKIHEVARIVYVSSSCVFEKSLAYPIRESDLESAPAPSPGYPFSKLLGEAYCRSFRQQYGVPYTIIRPFNVYGPGEMPGSQTGKSHVIPDLTAKLLRGQHPLEIFGDGTHTRSFTHVGDIARGIVSGLESPQPVNEDFNLGHTVEVSILELAKKLWRICGRTDHFASRSVGRHAIDVKKRGLHACDNATQFPV